MYLSRAASHVHVLVRGASLAASMPAYAPVMSRANVRMVAEGVAPDARVQIVAAYNVAKDIDTILRDAKRATILSVLLVTCVLVFGFRTVRALALVLVPMGIATCVTLACAALLLPQLNALTIFLFAVLFGMGVDFSVHLFALRPGDHAARWPAVIERPLRPLTASMLTTTSSLAILGIADFKAFREFGAISAVVVPLEPARAHTRPSVCWHTYVVTHTREHARVVAQSHTHGHTAHAHHMLQWSCKL